MKLRLLASGIVIGVASALFTSHAISQEQGGMPAPSPDEMQQMMKAWKDAVTPGEHHEKLKHFVGEWDTTIRVWWSGPAGPPIETAGASSIEMVLDGRFVMEDFTGEVMMPDASGAMKPVSMNGIALTGYDNFRKMYVGSWVDNHSTHLISIRGSMDPTGKVITMYGEADEPMLGVVGRTLKYVTRIIDDKSHVFEMYDLHAGDNYKVFEILYTRK